MKTSIFITLTIVTSLLIAGCSSAPRVIRGSVVMRTASEAHVNLGANEGIQVGDTLAVLREEPLSSHETRTIRLGLVRVTKLIDNYYAAVEVLEGSIADGDIVEKKAR